MKVQDTLTFDDVTVVIRASMLEQSLYTLWMDRFAELDKSDLPNFDLFLLVAASIVDIQGLDWHRPPRQTEEDAMIDSYTSLFSQITMPFFNELFNVINGLNSTMAPALDMADELLSDEQKKITP